MLRISTIRDIIYSFQIGNTRVLDAESLIFSKDRFFTRYHERFGAGLEIEAIVAFRQTDDGPAGIKV